MVRTIKIIGCILFSGYIASFLIELVYLVACVQVSLNGFDKPCKDPSVSHVVNYSQSECSILQQHYPQSVYRFSFQNNQNGERDKSLGYQQKLVLNSNLHTNDSNKRFSSELYFKGNGRDGENIKTADSHHSNETTIDAWGSGMVASGFEVDTEMMASSSGNGPGTTEETYSKITYAPATTEDSYSTFIHGLPREKMATISLPKRKSIDLTKISIGDVENQISKPTEFLMQNIGESIRFKKSIFRPDRLVDEQDSDFSFGSGDYFNNEVKQFGIINRVSVKSNNAQRLSNTTEQEAIWISEEITNEFDQAGANSSDIDFILNVNPIGQEGDMFYCAMISCPQNRSENNWIAEKTTHMKPFLDNRERIKQYLNNDADGNTTENVLRLAFETENSTESNGYFSKIADNIDGEGNAHDTDKLDNRFTTTRDHPYLESLQLLTNKNFENLNGSHLSFGISNVQINFMCYEIDSQHRHAISKSIEHFTAVINGTNTDVTFDYSSFGSHNKSSNNETVDEITSKQIGKWESKALKPGIQRSRLFTVLYDLIGKNVKGDNLPIVTSMFELMVWTISSKGQNVLMGNDDMTWWRQTDGNADTKGTTQDDGDDDKFCNLQYQYTKIASFTQVLAMIATACVCFYAYQNTFQPSFPWSPSCFTVGTFLVALLGSLSVLAWHASIYVHPIYPWIFWSTIGSYIYVLIAAIIILSYNLVARRRRNRVRFDIQRRLEAANVSLGDAESGSVRPQETLDETAPLLRENTRDASTSRPSPSTSTPRPQRGDTSPSQDFEKVQYDQLERSPLVTQENESRPINNTDHGINPDESAGNSFKNTNQSNVGDEEKISEAAVSVVEAEKIESVFVRAPNPGKNKKEDDKLRTSADPEENPTSTQTATNADNQCDENVTKQATDPEANQNKHEGVSSLTDIIIRVFEKVSGANIVTDNHPKREDKVQDHNKETKTSVGPEGNQAGAGNCVVEQNKTVGDGGAAGISGSAGNIVPVRAQPRNVSADDVDDEAISLEEPSRTGPSRRSGYPGIHGRRNTRRERGINIESDADDGFDEP